jgi:membrane-anchored protein YejM (alkaline phosphatase superfamily)
MPIGLLLLTLFLWILYLSQLSLGVVLGNRLFAFEEKEGWSLFWRFAVGVIIIQALTFIPYVRFFVNLASVIFGLGAILLMIKASIQAYRGDLSHTHIV